MAVRYFLAAAALLAAAPAQARLIEFSFNGTVAATPTVGIVIAQPGGYTPYTGSNAPTYPVQAGDSLSVTFKTSLTERFPPTVQPDADGYYRLRVGGTGSGQVAGAGIYDISVGSLGRTGGMGLAFGGMDLLFNPASGDVRIDLGQNGYSFGYVSLPSYGYDPATDLFSPEPSCLTVWDLCTRASGTATSLTFSPLPIGLPNGDIAGFLGPLTINGSFSLPVVGQSVPAPPALALFGLPVALLAWRRRRLRVV